MLLLNLSNTNGIFIESSWGEAIHDQSSERSEKQDVPRLEETLVYPAIFGSV